MNTSRVLFSDQGGSFLDDSGCSGPREITATHYSRTPPHELCLQSAFSAGRDAESPARNHGHEELDKTFKTQELEPGASGAASCRNDGSLYLPLGASCFTAAAVAAASWKRSSAVTMTRRRRRWNLPGNARLLQLGASPPPPQHPPSSAEREVRRRHQGRGWLLSGKQEAPQSDSA
ncbi:uncharacterized protein V6R79_014908 [Siganus canaliculatus]